MARIVPRMKVYRNEYTNKWHSLIITEEHATYQRVVPLGQFDSEEDAKDEARIVLYEYRKTHVSPIKKTLPEPLETNLEFLKERYQDAIKLE